MLIEEFYRRLSLGPLSNLAIGMDGAGTLTTKGQSQAHYHLNKALRDLSGRFILSYGNTLIYMQEGKSSYQLITANSYSAQAGVPVDERTFFIPDTVENPFPGRVIKILNVFLDGVEVPLNQLDDPSSMHSVGDTLIVPYNYTNVVLAVGYQRYLDEVASDLATEIPVPLVLETAVELYTAAGIYQDMNSQENLVRAANLKAQYEAECLRIENKDLLGISEIAALPKFSARGFV